MKIMDYEIDKQILLTEVEYQKYWVNQENTENIANEKLRLIDMKRVHSFEVVKDGSNVVNMLKFNPTVKEFSKIAFLYHDIGRFYQMRLTGNYTDFELLKFMKSRGIYNISNHGQLGANILSNILESRYKMLSKENREIALNYYGAIKQIVKNHVDAKIDNKDLLILISDLLKNNDILELLETCTDDIRNSIINAITQIVQDVDRLDIYHQILDGRWVPPTSFEKVDDKILNMYYNGEYLDIKLLKQKGLWNPNVGELVRLSFINQIRLLSVAKMLDDENVIIRLKNNRCNPITSDAYDFASEKLKKLIKTSNDGVTIGKSID